jgi:hypothetical protein
LLDYVSREESHPVVGKTNYPVVGKTNYEPVLKKSCLYRNASANFLPMIAATLPQRATGEPDEIFAAIERHRAAVRGSLAAIDRRGRLRQIIPEARRRWESDEKPGRCTDAPEWIEANTAIIEADEELDKALEAVLSTPPTTIAGVADLLDYVSREEWEVVGAGELADDYSETILENALERGLRKAAANLLPMIATTLRSLTAESS